MREVYRVAPGPLFPPAALDTHAEGSDTARMPNAMTAADRALLDAAIEEAERSLSRGGIPIGAALGDATGAVLSRGHNERVQTGDPTAHAEIVCLRRAGRRRDWRGLTLATTLSPCCMCAGAIALYRIGRVVIGESETFLGDEAALAARGVTLVHAADERCVTLMRQLISQRPDLWNEDIGE